MFHLWLQIFLTCTIFPILFVNDCLKNVLLEILGFVSPKLGGNDYFTMVNYSPVDVLALVLV